MWALAVYGGLDVGAEVACRELPSPLPSEERTEHDIKALDRMQEALRSEMDCHVCYSLLSDPLTMACGHTFCRTCLRHVLDHSRQCPVCRRKLAISPLLSPSSCPSNECITAIETFWTDEAATRREADRAAQPQDLDLPLFRLHPVVPHDAHLPLHLRVAVPPHDPAGARGGQDLWHVAAEAAPAQRRHPFWQARDSCAS